MWQTSWRCRRRTGPRPDGASVAGSAALAVQRRLTTYRTDPLDRTGRAGAAGDRAGRARARPSRARARSTVPRLPRCLCPPRLRPPRLAPPRLGLPRLRRFGSRRSRIVSATEAAGSSSSRGGARESWLGCRPVRRRGSTPAIWPAGSGRRNVCCRSSGACSRCCRAAACVAGRPWPRPERHRCSSRCSRRHRRPVRGARSSACPRSERSPPPRPVSRSIGWRWCRIPGPEWTTVVAALLDGVDVVVAVPPGPIGASMSSRLAARARQRGSVFVAYGHLPGADLVLNSTRSRWEGLGQGTGRLRQREMTIVVRGRGSASQSRQGKFWAPVTSSHERGLARRQVGAPRPQFGATIVGAGRSAGGDDPRRCRAGAGGACASIEGGFVRTASTRASDRVSSKIELSAAQSGLPLPTDAPTVRQWPPHRAS